MTLSETQIHEPVNVSDFVSYLAPDFLKDDDDGSDLPLPDLEALQPSAESSGAMSKSSRPVPSRPVPSRTALSNGASPVEESGQPDAAFEEGIEPVTSSSQTTAAVSDTERKRESQDSGHKGQRQQRRGRKRDRPVNTGTDAGSVSATNEGMGSPDPGASSAEISEAITPAGAAESSGEVQSDGPQGDTSDSTDESGSSRPRKQRRGRRRGRGRRTGSDGTSGEAGDKAGS